MSSQVEVEQSQFTCSLHAHWQHGALTGRCKVDKTTILHHTCGCMRSKEQQSVTVFNQAALVCVGDARQDAQVLLGLVLGLEQLLCGLHQRRQRRQICTATPSISIINCSSQKALKIDVQWCTQ